MHQYGYATSSVAPTPVIPNIATAAVAAPAGSENVRPDATSPHCIGCPAAGSSTTHATVANVNSMTRTVVSRSTSP